MRTEVHMTQAAHRTQAQCEQLANEDADYELRIENISLMRLFAAARSDFAEAERWSDMQRREIQARWERLAA
jgi:hypothetical protein